MTGNCPMNNAEWVLIDTETTGFKPPIFVVEIGAQRMQGWAPKGPSFRKLLNQNEDIPPEAARVHGYTREILERDGEPAVEVYAAFADYTEGLPVVAYNMRYDWDDVLVPEWKRLGIKVIGTPGFCALRLAQRLLDPVPAGNCKLQTLRQFYRLPERGAHTAMGDVETVIDLLQNVLKPLAEERNLTTWDNLRSYADAEYYPSRIAFGKFKGRDFRDAAKDQKFREWLVWLSGSERKRFSQMGAWYLAQLDCAESQHKTIRSDSSADSNASAQPGTAVAAYQNIKEEELRILVEAARTRLAELEASYTRDQRTVDNVRATIFNLVRGHYIVRDRLKLKVHYRRIYLDTLLRGGEEEAEEIIGNYDQARAETEEDYKKASAAAEESRKLSEEQGANLSGLWKKLVRLFHPDLHANDPQKSEVYRKLMAAINDARDRGDIELLEEIAHDPETYIKRQGWETLDLGKGNDLASLEPLYASLQIRIIELLELIDDLRESPDYELAALSKDNPTLLEEVAEEQKAALSKEIAELEIEAAELQEEIDTLTDNGEAGIA
jgi:DNA polymerase III epsilon subunit-like protein